MQRAISHLWCDEKSSNLLFFSSIWSNVRSFSNSIVLSVFVVKHQMTFCEPFKYFFSLLVVVVIGIFDSIHVTDNDLKSSSRSSYVRAPISISETLSTSLSRFSFPSGRTQNILISRFLCPTLSFRASNCIHWKLKILQNWVCIALSSRSTVSAYAYIERMRQQQLSCSGEEKKSNGQWNWGKNEKFQNAMAHKNHLSVQSRCMFCQILDGRCMCSALVHVWVEQREW